MKYEIGLGPDVAAVQQIDASTSAYIHENDIINNNEKCENSFNNELTIQTHYVCCTWETILQNKDVQNTVRIGGFCNLMAENNNEENELEDNYNPYHHLSKEQKAAIDALTTGQNLYNAGNSNRYRTVKSYRSSDPINEFYLTDKLVTSTFPCIFPLGSCFKQSAGNLNNEQLNHLLKQFHMIPSKNKRFLGYLADIRRCSEVIKKA